MIESLNILLEDRKRVCGLCGSNNWRVLHAGDESNCECEGECLRVCDNPEIEQGCDGISHLVMYKCEECWESLAMYKDSLDKNCENTYCKLAGLNQAGKEIEWELYEND
jgi:hypothetical protein